MARETSKQLRNNVMYSVFVRNHTAEGTFNALCEDLDRIKSMGVDIVWLMPIHPIGKVARKGVLGSPYAISDYRAINPEFGTMDDFKKLVDEIHSRGMKCIIDVVYNHTSPDSTLVREHPEWFYRKPDGKFGNKVGEWLDVIDLDYKKIELWDYQIETLKMWAGIVDGFRCDVAPLIPLEFWLRARAEVAKVRPDCLWLSESVEPVFTIDNRARGMVSLSDSEIFQAFDLCYEYDIYSWFVGYLTGVNSLKEYIDRSAFSVTGNLRHSLCRVFHRYSTVSRCHNFHIFRHRMPRFCQTLCNCVSSLLAIPTGWNHKIIYDSLLIQYHNL